MKAFSYVSSHGIELVTEQATERESKGKSILDFPNRFVVIDIETTGLDPRYDDIIELSALRVIDGEIEEEFSELINIGYDVSGFITEYTGISNKMLKRAETIDKVLPRFLTFVGEDSLVGYNVHFDVNFIYDNTLKCFNKYFSNNIIDVMRLAKNLVKDSKNHKLQTIAEYLNVDFDKLHRGIIDCKVTLECYKELRKLVIQKYSSEENYLKSLGRGLRAADISTGKVDFDEMNPLFEKNCSFTGTLANMTRREAFQLVADFGGKPQDGVTKNTNYLVLGDTDYTKVKNGKSSKLNKAEKYQLEGLDIQIISEQVFYDMISSPNTY